MNNSNYDRPGYDSDVLKEEAEWEGRIQLISITDVNNKKEDFIIIKSPPATQDEAPNRSVVKQLRVFKKYSGVRPEDYIQFTVMQRTDFEDKLRRANELSPRFSTSMPAYPESYDLIDQYTLQKVSDMMSGGFDISLFFHKTEHYFLLPGKDMMTPSLEDALRAVEIISVAHKWPVKKLVDFNGLREISFNTLSKKYMIQSLADSRSNDSTEVFEAYKSILALNSVGVSPSRN